MTTAYEDVLAGLKKKGNTEKVEATFPPTVKLHSKGGANAGVFLSGTLKARKLVMINTKLQPVYNITLGKTDAPILKKNADKKWVDTTAKEGDLVSFFAPTRLDRVLRDLGSGVDVVILYDGMKPIQTPHGMKDTHMFTVNISRTKAGESFVSNPAPATADKQEAAPVAEAQNHAEPAPVQADPFA